MEVNKIAYGSNSNLCRRFQVRLKCPNPLFEKWLEEWRLEAEAKDLNIHHTFRKALISLRKFPVTLKSGMQCMILENFGSKLCKKLDEKLSEYRKNYSNNGKNHRSVSPKIVVNFKNRRRKREQIENKSINANGNEKELELFTESGPVSKIIAHDEKLEVTTCDFNPQDYPLEINECDQSAETIITHEDNTNDNPNKITHSNDLSVTSIDFDLDLDADRNNILKPKIFYPAPTANYVSGISEGNNIPVVNEDISEKPSQIYDFGRTSKHFKKPYVPRKGSGAYALLITLHDDLCRFGPQAGMTKEQLIKAAQVLCDVPFNEHWPGSHYTAWSAMGKLTEKMLVWSQDRPARYRLTPLGIKLAESLVDVTAADNSMNDFGSCNVPSTSYGIRNNLPLNINEPSTSKEIDDFGSYPKIRRPRTKDTSTYLMPQFRGGPAHTLSSSDDDDVNLQDRINQTQSTNLTSNKSINKRFVKKTKRKPSCTIVRPTLEEDNVIDDINSGSTNFVNLANSNKTSGINLNVLEPEVFNNFKSTYKLSSSDNDDDMNLQDRINQEKTTNLNVTKNINNRFVKKTKRKPNCTIVSPALEEDKFYRDERKSENKNITSHVNSGKTSGINLLVDEPEVYNNFMSTYKLSSSDNDDDKNLQDRINQEKTTNLNVTKNINKRFVKKRRRKPSCTIVSPALEEEDVDLDERNSESKNITSHVNSEKTSCINFDPIESEGIACNDKNQKGNILEKTLEDLATHNLAQTSQRTFETRVGSINRKVVQELPLGDDNEDIFEDLSQLSLPRPPSPTSQNTFRTSQSSVASLHENIEMLPGQYHPVLLVDTAEMTGKISAEALKDKFLGMNVNCEIRHLNVGDYAWICRDQDGHELILPYIVERKRLDDFSKSIKDGRFHEQKFRLKSVPVKQRIYVVEGFGKANIGGLPLQTLMQAASNTQLIDGFIVKFTKDYQHTLNYLSVLTRKFANLLEGKILMNVLSNELPPFNWNDNILHSVTFKDFMKNANKKKKFTVREMFVKHLLQLHGVSVEKAKAIVDKYPCPRLLLEAYQNGRGDENLFSKVKVGNLQRSLGAVISKNIYNLYSKDEFT